MSAKSDALEVFTNLKIFIEKHLQLPIKTVRTNWGGKFRTFSSLLTNSGIHFRHPYPHIHHQNGKTERKHIHIVDVGLTLLAQAHLPLKFWWNAFHIAVYLINRLPTPVLNNISPFQKLFHSQPDYSILKTFGGACYPTLRPYNRHKFDFKTARCIFIGYSSQHKGYQCLHSSRRVYISNHVTFDESSFPYESRADFSSISSSCQSTAHSESSLSSSTPSVTQLQAPLAASSEHHLNVPPVVTPVYFSNNFNSTSSSPSPPSHNPPPHTLLQPASSGHPMITRSKASIFKPKVYLSALLAQKSEPTSVSKVLSDPMCYKAMQEEYLALKTNHI